MKKQRIIPRKYLPARYPINATVLHGFLMYYFQPAQWFMTLWITVLVLVWVIILIGRSNTEIDKNLLND